MTRFEQGIGQLFFYLASLVGAVMGVGMIVLFVVLIWTGMPVRVSPW